MFCSAVWQRLYNTVSSSKETYTQHIQAQVSQNSFKHISTSSLKKRILQMLLNVFFWCVWNHRTNSRIESDTCSTVTAYQGQNVTSWVWVNPTLLSSHVCSYFIHKQALCGTADPTTVQSSSSSPSSSVRPEHGYSTGRMPLASSSFLRVSSHWVNCLDSRNICQSEFRISGWRFITATFYIIKRSLRLQAAWAADTYISEGDVFLSPLILKDTKVQIEFVMPCGSALCSYVTTIMKEII